MYKDGVWNESKEGICSQYNYIIYNIFCFGDCYKNTGNGKDVTESGTSNIPQAIKEVESGVVKLLVYAN